MSKYAEGIAEEVRKLGKEALGATFWLQTTVFSSALGTTAQNLTAASLRGDLIIEDIIIRGHSGTLGGAGGGLVSSSNDTLQILCTNTYGSSVVFAARLADVGTSMTVDMTTARDIIVGETSTLANRRSNPHTVLEEGKQLTIKVLQGTMRGDGKADIRVKFRKFSDDATVTV